MLNIYFHKNARIAEGQTHQRCEPFPYRSSFVFISLEGDSLPSHFPPLIHHPELILPSFSSLVPMSLPPRFKAPLPFSAAGKQAKTALHIFILLLLMPLSFPVHSLLLFLVSLLPWECFTSSETPNGSLITKRTDAMNCITICIKSLSQLFLLPVFRHSARPNMVTKNRTAKQ